MLYKPYTGKTAIQQIQKLNARITRLFKNGDIYKIPFYKRLALLKRYRRYLKRILAPVSAQLKMVNMMTAAMLLSTDAFTQVPCRTFVNADINNPLHPQTLNFPIHKPVFVDIDDDGDLDCYAIYPDEQEYVRFAFLENIGTKNFPVFQENKNNGGLPQTTDIINFDEYLSNEGLVFADIDGDGDYDCFISNYYDTEAYTEFFENTGDKIHPSFVRKSSSENPLRFIDGSYALNFNLVDLDADSDLDLLTFDIYYSEFYKNKGTRENPQFVKIKDYVNFLNPYFGHYIFTDWNGDGLTDAIQCNYWYPGFFINDGTATRPHFKEDTLSGPLFPEYFMLYSLVDLNNDGFPEAFSANGEYAVTSPVAQIVAASASKLQAYPKGDYRYQWKRNGKNIPGAKQDYLEIQHPGKYTVNVLGNCGTGISFPYIITDSTSIISSIDNMHSQNNTSVQLNLYPNPFTNEFTLRFEKAGSVKTVIQIMNAEGRLVSSQSTNQSTIKLGKDLKPGIYFLQVIQNNNMIYRQKIIKQ